jgi:2-haloacid dehalogenase
MPADIKAALFDVFGTVVDWREGIARDVAAFFRRHGISGDAHAFADAWRGRYQDSMEPIRRGVRPFTRLDELHRENLLATFAAWRVDTGRFDARDIDDLNRAWHGLDPWPDSVEGLRRLREGCLVAPLSNGNIALLANMAKRAGLPWDCILGAEVAQAYKPHPDAYLRTSEVLGLAPRDCLMVAAHNSDLHAARAVGMRTAFVPRPSEHGPSQTTDLEPDFDWDFVARDLVTLSRLVTGAALSRVTRP